jgi:MSHA biogenesis protein MshI
MSRSFKSLLSLQPKGWSAVDLQGGLFGVSVQLPEVAGGKPIVLQRVAFPAQEVDAAVLAQMGRVWGGGNLNLVTVLGRHEYQLFMVDKPAVRPDEIEGSLRLVISPMIDYPAAEANLAWLDIPVRQTLGSRAPQLYVVVARAGVVKERKDMFGAARLRLDAVDIRETAQRNIANLLNDDQAATCLICVEPEGVQLTVTFRHELYLIRFISESFLDKGGVENRQALVAAVDRLALEIQRSFDFVRRNFPALNINALHVAPMPVEMDLVDLLKSQLIEEVTSLDLADIFDFLGDADLKKPQVQAQYFHALGSALRMSSPE